MSRKLVFYYIILLLVFFASGCSDGGGSSSRNVVISWSANKESAVNTTGGGYNVYYSSSSGFSLNDSEVTQINVAYSSGSTSPTSTNIILSSGTYYIRVAGYSALASGTTSALSPQISITVP
jgi:hypothetical protein